MATFAQPQDTHRSKSATSFYDSTGASFGRWNIPKVLLKPGVREIVAAPCPHRSLWPSYLAYKFSVSIAQSHGIAVARVTRCRS